MCGKFAQRRTSDKFRGRLPPESMRPSSATVGWPCVVNEGKLSTVLGEFARTLTTDFPIQGILDHLIKRVVEVLPVTSAGVTLIVEGSAPRYVSGSDSSALRFERLQTHIGEGPCLLAHESGEAVAAPDLATDARFPRLATAAAAAGMAAVFTFPLRHSAGHLGALDLYRDTPGDLDPEDAVAAQTLADVAAAYLLNAEARQTARTMSEQFRRSSLHDGLTGLPNRLMLLERIEYAALRARRSHSNSAILFADLDRFKQVNDAHGHQSGDQLLLAISRRLSSLVRPGDTLARFSGDEFVFLCEDLESVADAEALAERIAAAFSTPFAIGGFELSITASVGTAYAGPGQDLSVELLANADMAMYQAKRTGGGRHQIFDLSAARRRKDSSDLSSDLQAAVTTGTLDVAYQPLVRGLDGLVTGVEALLRWTHPDRGAVPPLHVIAAAERSGLIHEIGAWMLERSCRDRARWVADNPGASLQLAVNVSGRQMMNGEFCNTVEGALGRTATDPANLVLEITENVFIDDGDRAVTVLNDLKDLGVRLALDDFGTGYSSLSYLRRLPIDIVKIDQSFVAGIDVAPTVEPIIAAVTNLAHALGLTVTAEGVETQRQHDEVTALGCDSAQGYFYARPMTASSFNARLRAGNNGDVHLPAEPSSAAR
jgi:diguanylate cyclase (GGDEF)-like protein